VLPRYQQGLAAELPIHFVDIAASGNEGSGLGRKVDMLPTVVLMLGGREIDHIVGYWGPENFFKLLAHMRAKVGSQPRRRLGQPLSCSPRHGRL
jgi:hypothetical protein